MSNLITNEEGNTLINRLNALIEKYNSKIDLRVISGFFNAKAFEALALSQDKLNSIKMILGKSEQAISKDDIAFYLDENELDIFDEQLDDIKATKIAHNFIKNHQVKIHTLHNDNHTLIHSKMYFLCDENNANIEQNAIIGSSNFTASGLGLTGGGGWSNPNKELNLLCDSKETTKDCKEYFDKLLLQCKDSTSELLNLLQTSYFYHSPKEVISKLAPYLKDETQSLSQNEQKDLDKGAKAYNLYDFQKFATEELLKRLKTYGVALLADPVGSGKTLSALAVASMYKRIAIITPPKLKAQWESYKDSDNEFILNQNLEFYTYDEATRKTHKQSFLKNADLVIVDESHHFRNPNKRYSNLKEKLGSESHLLLLSATPINNNYLDLAYQLTLNKSSLIINDQELKPIEICKQADKLANENEESILNTDYYKLCNLIFSRSAKEIVSYLKAIGKSLPAKNIQIKNFSSIPSHIDFNINRLLDILGVNDTKDSTKDSIKFCIYDPYKEEYLPQKIIDKLKSNNAENLGAYSTPRGFLCMSLIKALESSIDAFLSILDKIITYHENFLNHTFDDGDEFADDNTFPQRLQNIIENGYKEVLLQAFEKDIEFDLKRLKHIKEKLSNYQSERDFVKSEKFIALKKLIASIKQSNKLIIFTESIVTANALTKALKESFLHFNIESITGDTKTKDFNSRRKRFSPKSLHYELKEGEREIDILIATDCLSEGQNLQDCANLLNWDIAFNPVRAIQRIGRIWRIGSKHQINNITHFFPDMRLENYIDLEAKLRYKLDAAGSATMIDNPFFQKQEAKYIKHKKLREQQLDLMKNEITALEDDSQVSFFSPQALLESLENNNITINSQLKDGIFSIAKHDKFAPNTLFALLQDITNNNAKQIESLYPCIYDMSENQLYPSISQKDKSNHLANIIALSSDEKLQDEFTRLEEFTQDYSDLSALKDKFAKLILSLNQSIDEYQATLEKAKKSDGGLSFVEERKFRLIAWLLINPDFTKLKGTK